MSTNQTSRKKSRRKRKEFAPAPHACSLCGYTSYNVERMVAHIARSHVSSEPFVCTRCNFRCGQHSRFRRHLASHGALACGECEFVSAAGGAGHARSHARDLPYGCDRCAFRARSLDELTQHVTAHGGSLAACNACVGSAGAGAGRRLCTPHAIASARLSTLHLCLHCQKLCVQRWRYRRITIHLSPGGCLFYNYVGGVLTCSLCSRTFSHKIAYYSHMHRHIRETRRRLHGHSCR